MAERPDPPLAWIERIDAVLTRLPECRRATIWTGASWKVGAATVAHLFGGEDQRFRIVFRADPDEVMAFAHLGEPYFKAGWGTNVVGLLLDRESDWEELAELLTDSYCIQAPVALAQGIVRPDGRLRP